jgi:hypothetical protein
MSKESFICDRCKKTFKLICIINDKLIYTNFTNCDICDKKLCENCGNCDNMDPDEIYRLMVSGIPFFEHECYIIGNIDDIKKDNNKNKKK